MQGPHIADGRPGAALDLNHHALQIRRVGYGEIEPPVNAPVGGTPGGDEPVHLLHGPFLELVGIPLPQILRALQVAGLSGYQVIPPLHQPAAVLQPHSGHPRNGVNRNINANPAPPQPVRRFNGSGAAAKGIQHQIARIGAGPDNPVHQGQRLLRGVAEPLAGCSPYNINLPHILH